MIKMAGSHCKCTRGDAFRAVTCRLPIKPAFTMGVYIKHIIQSNEHTSRTMSTPSVRQTEIKGFCLTVTGLLNVSHQISKVNGFCSVHNETMYSCKHALTPLTVSLPNRIHSLPLYFSSTSSYAWRYSNSSASIYGAGP